jgi:Autotransporter beta-domain
MAAQPSARAHTLAPTPGPTPTPSSSPIPTPTLIQLRRVAGRNGGNLGSNLLERLANQATGGFDRSFRINPAGGGASEAAKGSTISRLGRGLRHFGDDRRARRLCWRPPSDLGRRCGYRRACRAGDNIGFSADQSRTSIDVPLAFQSATLTQLGFNASVDKGPWTRAIALVHGFGRVNSSRDTGQESASAGYNAKIDGALTQLSYYWNIDQSRVVPKAAFEYVRASTGSFQEIGGLDPVMASGATVLGLPTGVISCRWPCSRSPKP